MTCPMCGSDIQDVALHVCDRDAVRQMWVSRLESAAQDLTVAHATLHAAVIHWPLGPRNLDEHTTEALLRNYEQLTNHVITRLQMLAVSSRRKGVAA